MYFVVKSKRYKFRFVQNVSNDIYNFVSRENFTSRLKDGRGLINGNGKVQVHLFYS